MLLEAEEFRERLASEIAAGALHKGLETERIMDTLLKASAEGVRPDAVTLAATLEESDRRLLFEIAFESDAPPTWDEAESCLSVLRERRAKQELDAVQKEMEALSSRAADAADASQLKKLLARKQELLRNLSQH
jgi:hypothetical protein